MEDVISMGKDFLKLKTDQKKLHVSLLVVGSLIAIAMGINAYRDTGLQNGYELPKNEAAEGAYEQELIAYIGEQKIPITVTVEEQKFSKEEAEAELLKASELLDDVLKGENRSLSEVTAGLNFVDTVPKTSVEVEWTEKLSDYFYQDGTLREDLEISEPLEMKISAILICQEYTKDYEAVVTLLPGQSEVKNQLLEVIERQKDENSESETMTLPKEYDGAAVTWKKTMDVTFVYFFALTIGAVFVLKVGSKRDENEAKRERLEELEKDYAQIVSKFAMLLSAGLSVRNAWERIVLLYRRKADQKSVIYQEMNWGLREMQKGVSELEVYEAFGTRAGQIHYKKLMALFISDKRRGSINLLEAMNQEMLQAWEEQKRKTRQRGEKTGTKLLIPMMGMLAVVFIMIIVPAFLSFGF